MHQKSFYTAAKIFTGERWLHESVVVVADGIIEDVVQLSSLSVDQKLIHFYDCVIAPAFIDLQIYGAGRKLFAVYPEAGALSELNQYCEKGGAAFCLPTVATNTKEVFHKCIDAVRNFWVHGGEGILGLHLEGPWINPLRKGAHVESLIHQPSLDEVHELVEYGKDVIKMITLAPEQCDDQIIEFICDSGIIISAGHSNASFTEASKAFEKGVKAVTHLYNAMSPLMHRAPGLVGAAMHHNSVVASIIPDGHHVDWVAVRIAKRLMNERLFIITDAVTETHDGYYRHQLSGDKFESEGILSGSALTMIKGVQNLVNFAGIETGEAIRMASTYPARLMGLNNLGTIEKGKESKLVVLDAALQVKQLL